MLRFTDMNDNNLGIEQPSSLRSNQNSIYMVLSVMVISFQIERNRLLARLRLCSFCLVHVGMWVQQNSENLI